MVRPFRPPMGETQLPQNTQYQSAVTDFDRLRLVSSAIVSANSLSTAGRVDEAQAEYQTYFELLEANLEIARHARDYRRFNT